MSALLIEIGPFNYSVHYSSRRRSIALQIKQGNLMVRAPTGVSVAEINNLVMQKQGWILKYLQTAQEQARQDWFAQQQLPLLGSLNTLELGNAKSSTVLFENEKVTVLVSNRTQISRYQHKARLLLQQWYKQQAEQWFTARVSFWQRQMHLHAAAIVIGNWKTKWGYCKHSGEVGFNWRLMMAPEWVADYVVVHELAHLQYLNHSAEFWHLVQQYCDQEKEAKSWLKQNQYWMDL